MNDSQNRAAALTNNAPRSSTAAARAVLGQAPRDVAMYLSISTESLDWLGAIFSAIEMLHQNGGGEIHIKHLAGLGKYVADDIGNLIGCEHEKLIASIEAAEAGEVQA